MFDANKYLSYTLSWLLTLCDLKIQFSFWFHWIQPQFFTRLQNSQNIVLLIAVYSVYYTHAQMKVKIHKPKYIAEIYRYQWDRNSIMSFDSKSIAQDKFIYIWNLNEISNAVLEFLFLFFSFSFSFIFVSFSSFLLID